MSEYILQNWILIALKGIQVPLWNTIFTGSPNGHVHHPSDGYLKRDCHHKFNIHISFSPIVPFTHVHYLSVNWRVWRYWPQGCLSSLKYNRTKWYLAWGLKHLISFHIIAQREVCIYTWMKWLLFKLTIVTAHQMRMLLMFSSLLSQVQALFVSRCTFSSVQWYDAVWYNKILLSWNCSPK